MSDLYRCPCCGATVQICADYRGTISRSTHLAQLRRRRQRTPVPRIHRDHRAGSLEAI